MSNENDTEIFNFSLKLITNALKTQNQVLVESYKNTLTSLLGSHYTADILIAALFELAETDGDTFSWVLEKFYYLEGIESYLRIITMFATRRLTELGFLLGQDFSVTSSGNLVVSTTAMKSLLDSISDAEERFLLQKILQVV